MEGIEHVSKPCRLPYETYADFHASLLVDLAHHLLGQYRDFNQRGPVPIRKRDFDRVTATHSLRDEAQPHQRPAVFVSEGKANSIQTLAGSRRHQIATHAFLPRHR